MLFKGWFHSFHLPVAKVEKTWRPLQKSVQYFDNRCDELLQECVFQQGRPVVVEEVDEKSFDVGAVLILGWHRDVGAVSWMDVHSPRRPWMSEWVTEWASEWVSENRSPDQSWSWSCRNGGTSATRGRRSSFCTEGRQFWWCCWSQRFPWSVKKEYDVRVNKKLIKHINN